MTRVEAINYFKGSMAIGEDDDIRHHNEVLEFTIKTLEQECEDAVSRQAVLDIVKFEENWLFDAKSNNADTDIAFSGIRTQVAKLLPVTPARKKGKWINIDATHSKCDRCGAVFEIASENGEVNYCPHCGAKMDERGKEV